MALDTELSLLMRGESLDRAQSRAAMERILAGGESAAQIVRRDWHEAYIFHSV